MPIEFDITGAKKAGYNYKEISSYLKDTYNVDFDVEGAKKAGYSDNAIMEYINKTYSDEPRVPRVPKEQTIQNPKEQQVVEAIKGSDAPQNRTPITISDEEIRSIKPHPRISSEEQQVVEAIKESEASQKRSEQSEGVKRILYNNNRYWRVQDKKEAQERGYNSVEDMYKDRESFMVNNYLSENDKQEVQNMLGYINAKKKGDEKSMEAYYRQYLDSRKVNREEYKSKRAELEDLKREIERQISDGLDAELGRKSIEGITKRINDLDLSQKAVINPKEEMNDFIKSNITEVASVSKPSQTPYQKLKEYTNLLYSEVLKRKEELGLDKDMGDIEKYFKDIKLRREAGAGDELEELYSKESKLRTAVKLLYLNRGSQTDENAGNVFVKAFGHSLSPSTKGEFSTNQEAANNLLSIIQESDIAKAVYEEQQKYAEEGAADYKPFSSKWFAQNTAPSAAIMLEYIPAAFLTNGAMGVLGLASKLEKAKEAGVLINGLKGYSNALNKYKALKTANTIGKEAVKIGAHGVDFAATSEVVSRLFPKEEDEVNAVTGIFGGSSGAATTRGIEAIGLVLQKVFGNKAGVAARVLSDLGSKMKIKDGAAKITIGEIMEEFGETYGQIYRDSDNWSEIKSKLNEQFGTLEQKTEFVILTGIMGIGMGKGTAIGKYLYDKSIKEYTSLPRSERAKVDSVLDSVKEAEIELNKEAVKEAPTVDEGNGAEKVDEVNDIKSEDIIEKEDSRSIEEKPTEQSAPITELPTEGEQADIDADTKLTPEEKEKAKVESTAKALEGEITFEGKRGQADSITYNGGTIKKGEEIELDNVNISQDDSMPDFRSGKYKVRMLSVDANGKKATLTLTDGNEVITTTVKDLRKAQAEAYHKAKADDSNPELVKAVEGLLGKKEEVKTEKKVEKPAEQKQEQQTEQKQETKPDQKPTIEQQVKTFGVADKLVKPVTEVANALFSGLKKVGLVAKESVEDWLHIGKADKADENSLDGFIEAVKKELPKVEKKESKIQSWLDKWNELKKQNDLKELDSFYNKVKVALNGYAQGKGVEAEFTELKKDIEDYAEKLKQEQKPKVSSTTEFDTNKQPINKLEDLQDVGEKIGGAKKGVTALTHEIMHPTVVEIINGAKEGNKVGAKHTKTIVEEFNKANPNNPITEQELIEGNDAFINGTTTDSYRAVQEFIAEAFEAYLHNGNQGFSKAFQEVLDLIRDAFKAVYNTLTGKEISPELKTMFDEILGGEAEKEKLGKQERKKIAHEKVDNIANLLKGALSVEDKNVKKAGFINQDKIIDLIAQAVKGLISAGIEIDEAISRVRSILEQQYDTSSIKDAQIKEGIENIELEEELKGYGIEDEAAAIGLINKHLKETDKDYTINSTDLKRAISNKRSGKEIEDGKIVTKKDRAFVKKLINKHPRLAESITEKGIKYTVLPDGVTLEEAQSIIDYLGEEMAIREFRNFNNGMPEAVRMAIGQVLIKDLEAKGETNTLLSFIEDFGSRTTDLAQGLRMLGLFKKLGSSTFISMAEKVVEKNREKRSKYDEARLNRLADAIRELQKDSIKKVLELAGVSDKINKIEKIEGGSISVGGARNEKSSYGENNKVVTKKRAEEARKALRGKKLFSGIPPEVIELGIYHIEAGSRAIGEFADAMTKEFGKKVRPYIRTIYEKSIIKLKDNGYKDSDFSSEADIDEYIIKEKASDIKKRINIAVSSGNKLAIKRAIEGIKTLEGSPIQGELLDELREEYKRDKEVIGLLNGGLFLGSDSSVRQAIRRELKDMKESIRDIVMAHYTVQDYVKQSLVEKLVDRAGLDINEATDLVRTIESEFDAMVSSKRSKIISKLTTKREKKKYKVKGIEDKIIEASNLGVLDTKELSDKWADIMGYPNLTEEHRSMIKALSDEVQYSKEGRQKDRALQRLLGYVATIKGIDKVDIGMGIWYANLLSGYTTQFVNFISTFANSMFGLMNLSLQMITHPKRGAFMAKGFYNGMINIGLKDAKEVLLTGYTPIRGGKIEGKDALELKEFKGLLSPLNAFKYVKRFMIATDTLLYAGNKEMRSYLHAIKEASSDESGLEPTQSVLDKAAELLYKDADSYIDAVNQADLEYEQRLDDINESNLPEKEKIREVRQAKRDRNIRVYEIMEQNRDEKVIGDSADYAARATYNYPPEGVLGLFARIANYGKDQLNKFAEEHDSKAGKAAGQSAKILATWVIPFTNIIANVANESLNYFPPVGYGRAARGNTSIFGLFSKKMDAQQRADAYYKAHIGMVAMSSLALYFLLNDDDDDNYIDITANGKGNYIDNYSLRDKGQIPYSIRIGDRYVSYQYTPLFIPLSIIGWMRDKQKYSSEKKVDEGTAIQLVRATQSIVKTLFDMTFVQGLNTFTNQLVNEDMMNEDKLKSMIGRSASTIVKPALVTQSARDLQAILEIPSKDVRGEIAGQLLQDIPVARDMYYNRVNVLGEPVIPNTDKFISKRKPHKIFDALEKLNITIEEPNRRRLIIEDNGVFRYATKEEFYKYSVSRGRSIKERLTELIEDKDRPLMSMDKKDARELVKRVITRITQVESAKIKQK